jgi:light-regulated signal transduction histidine kinase (bacteriophytochrome)
MIQPHGTLLALHGAAREITQVAASCEALLGVAAGQLLGRPLAEALGDELVEAVSRALAIHAELPDQPAFFRWVLPGSDRAFAGSVHLAAPLVILELERAPVAPPAADTMELASLTARRVRTGASLESKMQAAVEGIRRLTGHDRVVGCRLREGRRGEVIAEARSPELESHLGRDYPFMDTPGLTGPTSIIADTNAPSSPLLPALNPVTGRPLDLSRGLLHGAAPGCLESLQSLGVRASLVLPLLRGPRPWGFITCHHRTPRTSPRELLAGVGWLAQDLAN